MNKRKYFIDENYFETIETEKQAYILGFIYSDGCIEEHPTTSALTFSQLEQDVDILYKIKEELKSEYPMFNVTQKINGKIKTRFYAYSRKLCEDLVKLGATPRKSLTLKFPFFLNDELLPHFIRGYFDGDGCIWNGKRRKMIVNDKTRKEGKRERIIHNVKFTITGNDSFIIDLQKKLIDKLGLKPTKLNYSKSKENNNTSDTVCTMEYSGRSNIKKLYEYMYKNATIYGERKFKKFNEILCAFDGKLSNETGLIAGSPLEP